MSFRFLEGREVGGGEGGERVFILASEGTRDALDAGGGGDNVNEGVGT